MVSFEVTREEKLLINAIALRAARRARGDAEYRRHIAMNVTACHANGTPLRLRELLEADEFNFLHDVNGIDVHICRKTGRMLHCFLPRFYDGKAAQKKEVVNG